MSWRSRRGRQSALGSPRRERPRADAVDAANILAKAPLVVDLAGTERDKQALTIIFANQSLGRPFAMPPGAPPERITEVRKAFAEMMKDPAFLADAAKRHLEINDPKTGEEVEALLKGVYSSSPEAVAAARTAVKEGEIKMRDEKQAK